MIKIRRADLSDAKIISALGITTFYEAYFELDQSSDLAVYVLESFASKKIEGELRDENSTFLIAESNEKSVGYAKLRENSLADCIRNETAIELQRIYLLEKVRSAGIGNILITECFTEAKKKGYPKIWLGVWEENLAAQNFYLKLGFETVGEMTFPYGETVGRNLVMIKNLSND